MRTLRSRKLRARLYLDYNGQCAICNKQLGKDWQADHKIPFILTQNTKYENLQPTCKTCNLKKGITMQKLTVDDYQNMKLINHIKDTSKLRTHQSGAINCDIYNTKHNKKNISIVLPTGYGKSDVIRLSIIELVKQKIIAGALIITPNEYLRNDIIEENKINSMISRYQIKGLDFSYDYVEEFRTPLFPNDEYMISMTTAMFALNAKLIAEHLKQQTIKKGLPYKVYIDECHTGREGASWGNAVKELNDVGIFVSLLTATPERADKTKIYGFSYDEKDAVDEDTNGKVIRKYTRNISDSEYELITEKGKILQIEPDYFVDYSTAWQEKVICEVDGIGFNVNVEIPTNDYSDKLKQTTINDMSTNEVNKYLGRVVKHDDVINEGTKILVSQLELYRMENPEIQGIVFCGNDNNKDEDDAHAKRIKLAIEVHNPDLNVRIVTNKQECPNKILKEFASGKGDIIVVKQMASVGLDILPLKVVLDLSPMRTKTSFTQRIHRGGRPYKHILRFRVIFPSDKIILKIFDDLILSKNGGTFVTDYEQIEQEIKLKKEKDEKERNDSFKVIGVEKPILLNNKEPDSKLDYDDFEYSAKLLLKKSPSLYGKLSNEDIMNLTNILLGKEKLQDSSSKNLVINNTKLRESKRKIINDYARRIASFKYDFKTQKDLWEKEIKKQIAISKRYTSSPKTALKRITNQKDLDKIINYMKTTYKNINEKQNT